MLTVIEVVLTCVSSDCDEFYMRGAMHQQLDFRHGFEFASKPCDSCTCKWNCLLLNNDVSAILKWWRMYNFLSTSQSFDYVSKFRPKYRLKRMFMGFMTLSIAVSHYQNAFAAIYLSEEEIPEPRIMHFDDGFDVLELVL